MNKFQFVSPCLRASVVILLLTASAQAANWQWQLSPERYKSMNAFERAQYDKAAAAVTAGNWPGAASEFEKFKVQFPDSDNLPYAIFMRGYALHQGKNRHTAVKVYQEVMDYFADSVDDAVPALYHMGVAHLDNGDTLKGLQCMKLLVESPKYQKHPLAAGALRRLAENHWNNKEFDQAAKYWRQAINDFTGVNDEERSHAVYGLAGYVITTKGYADYESSVTTPETREDAATRRALAEMLWQKAWAIYTNPASFDRKKQVTEKELADEQKALYDYLKGTKPWWEKANDLATYYDRVVSCQVYFVKDKDERDRLVEEAVAYVKTVQAKDKAAADAQLSRLVDVLRDGRAYERGRYAASLMTDKLAAAYKEYELLAHEASQVDGARWPAAEQALLAIEAGGTPEWKLRAMGERARIYREYLNQQDKAIALYQQMNNPPHNLWSIQECYKRMGKLDTALGVLTEIENSFPDWAPRAAWHKAAYLKEAGDGKKAVAQGRRILKLYPKSPESSQAHQLLEEYGIATGGGLKEEE